MEHVPAQHGVAPLHASPSPAHAGAPQVPLGALGEDRTQTVPEQQSESAVQSPLVPWQGAAQVWDVRSQFDEQHWPFEVQAVVFGKQLTHCNGVPVHSLLQQSAPVVQPIPTSLHEVVSTPHLNPGPAPSKRHEFGAQQAVSSALKHVAPVGEQLGGGAVQWRTPPASGTQGAPLQH